MQDAHIIQCVVQTLAKASNNENHIAIFLLPSVIFAVNLLQTLQRFLSIILILRVTIIYAYTDRFIKFSCFLF